MLTDARKEDLRQIEAGETTTKEVAEKHGVSISAVYMWKKALRDEGSKPKRQPKAEKKPAKKKRTKEVAEPPVTLLSAHHVNDEWSLPHPLGELVVCAELLRDEDSFDVLARLEAAVAAHRDLMERRAAA